MSPLCATTTQGRTGGSPIIVEGSKGAGDMEWTDANSDDAAWPPEGWLDRDGACRMFGVASTTWLRWQREGRVTCARRFRRPGDGHTCVLYPIGALERLREEIERAGKPYPDPDRARVW